MNDPGDATDTGGELEELLAQSRRRQAALRELAAGLPAAQSRRTLLAEMFRDLLHAPDKPGVVRRMGLKIVRTPADLLRRKPR